MDRLEAMAILVAVTEAGSLSAGARALGTPLATVSRKVAELERHLKVRLLTRSTRQLTMTDAGRAYVAACRRILDEVDAAERVASGEYSTPRGELVITAPVVFGRLHVLPVVLEFLHAWPEIDIRLVLADRVIHLLDDHIDVAIRIGALPDSALAATTLGSIRRVTCASPGYLASHGIPAVPEQLQAHACVSFDPAMTLDAWRFGSGATEQRIPVHARLVVNTAEAAIDAAVSGLGITRVLSYQVAGARRAGLLDLVLEAFEPPPSPVSLVHGGQALPPLKLRAFIDFAVPRLRAALARTHAAADGRTGGPGLG